MSSVERHVYKLRQYHCENCGTTSEPMLAWDYQKVQCSKCGSLAEEAGYRCGEKAPGVIGDECDVVVKHGICWPDGTPRHYRSKSEMRRVAAQMGLSQHVEHIPQRGSDKSPHTTKWT